MEDIRRFATIGDEGIERMLKEATGEDYRVIPDPPRGVQASINQKALRAKRKQARQARKRNR